MKKYLVDFVVYDDEGVAHQRGTEPVDASSEDEAINRVYDKAKKRWGDFAHNVICSI